MMLKEQRGRLYVRIFRYLLSCVPHGVTKVSFEDLVNYTDAPPAELHGVLTAMVRDGLLDWRMFFDCPACHEPNEFSDEAIDVGIKSASMGKCRKCGEELAVMTAAPQLRPEYEVPLWWWSELLPPKVDGRVS